ncbi:hypothetical protein RQP46_007711 [Phenoliferia psychrophenolica]
MRKAFTLLEETTVLHEQSVRLASRGAEVLGAVAAELEQAEGREREAVKIKTPYEYSATSKGPDTIFRIQSLMMDLQNFATDFTSSCTKDRLVLLVHQIPSTHALIATLNKNLGLVVAFYKLTISTESWESEDAQDREKDLAALPRLFRIAVAYRGPVWNDFLLEFPSSPDPTKRREEFINWVFGKNEHLRPKEGTAPARAWTLPSPPASPLELDQTPPRPEKSGRSASVVLVPYQYGPSARRPDSIVSSSPTSTLLPSPSLERTTPLLPSQSPSIVDVAPSPTLSPTSPTSPNSFVESPIRDKSFSMIDEDLVSASAPGSPTASSALSQTSSYASHLFPTPLGETDPIEENETSSPPLSPQLSQEPETKEIVQEPTSTLLPDAPIPHVVTPFLPVPETEIEASPQPKDEHPSVTGVGTGGLIAILLGRLRLSIDDALEVYICIAELAFRGKDRAATRSRWSKLFSSGGGGDSEGRDGNLIKALRNFLPESPMLDDNEDAPCRTAVLTFQSGKPRWIRSYDDEAGLDDRDALTVQQVARATLASTPFFKPFRPSPTVAFTETSTAPNPSDATFDEVRRTFGAGASVACFLSIGIGRVSVGTGKDASKGGGAKQSKTRAKSLRFVAELETQGSRAAERFRGRARKEGFEDQYLRYSASVDGKTDPGVDEWATLKPIAAAIDGWMRTSHSLGSASPLFRGLAGDRLGFDTMRSKKSSGGGRVRRSMSVNNLTMNVGYFHHGSGSTSSLV